MSEHRAYTPPGSLVPFFLSEKFISLVVGPYGSSKTTAGIMKIAYHAKRMAPCRDGIRRSRAVWVRTSRQTLLDTSIPDFLKWLPDGVAGTFYKTELKFILRFDDVECEILFRGLDDANDVRRLLSLQASFAIFDEFREIHQDIYENMQPRLGRYPDKDMVKPRPEWGVDHKGDPIGGCVREDGQPNKLLWGMSNPPDLDTFWEGVLTDPPDNVHVTIQPSGLSPEADWIQYLPTDYYEDLMKGKSQDWIDVCVHAKFGKSLSGKPVYASTFNSDFHIAKTPFIPLKDSSKPIVIGLDFGRTPAAVFFQRNVYGQIVCLGEITSENMGIDTFLNTKLKMFLVERFPGCTFVVAPDPAGWHKQQIGEISPVDVIKQAGLRCVKPATNDPERRIQAVERLLTGNAGGKPLLVINPDCKVLIQGFRSGYRYKLKRDGIAEVTPQKNEFSHVHDAAQYAALVSDGNVLGGQFGSQRREVTHVHAGGWT